MPEMRVLHRSAPTSQGEPMSQPNDPRWQQHYGQQHYGQQPYGQPQQPPYGQPQYYQPQPVAYQPQPHTSRTSVGGGAHTVHMILTVCTCGLWSPVWFLHWLFTRSKTRHY